MLDQKHSGFNHFGWQGLLVLTQIHQLSCHIFSPGLENSFQKSLLTPVCGRNVFFSLPWIYAAFNYQTLV